MHWAQLGRTAEKQGYQKWGYFSLLRNLPTASRNSPKQLRAWSSPSDWYTFIKFSWFSQLNSLFPLKFTSMYKASPTTRIGSQGFDVSLECCSWEILSSLGLGPLKTVMWWSLYESLPENGDGVQHCYCFVFSMCVSVSPSMLWAPLWKGKSTKILNPGEGKQGKWSAVKQKSFSWSSRIMLMSSLNPD